MGSALPERFLDALEAAAPDVRYLTVVEEIVGSAEFGEQLVDGWRQSVPGFRQRFEGLVVEGRRKPLTDEELVTRLHAYLRELELVNVDTGHPNRAQAAKQAGLRLNDVIRFSDPKGRDFDEGFAQIEAEILGQSVVELEDRTMWLAGLSKKDAHEQGWDFRQVTPMTTLLKSRSARHQEGSSKTVVVEGEVKHSHRLEQARAVALELGLTKDRFALPSAPRPKLVKEAS